MDKEAKTSTFEDALFNSIQERHQPPALQSLPLNQAEEELFFISSLENNDEPSLIKVNPMDEYEQKNEVKPLKMEAEDDYSKS